VQCVNCSVHVVTINFVIPTSKFPLVVSDSKYKQVLHFLCMRYRRTSAMVCKYFVLL